MKYSPNMYERPEKVRADRARDGETSFRADTLNEPRMHCLVLRVETPACFWCRSASTGEAELGIRIRSHLPIEGDRCVEEVRMAGGRAGPVAKELATLDTVHEVEVLEAGEDRATLRVTADACPLTRAAQAAGVTPEFPFPVREGRDRWTLIGTKAKARVFLEALQDHGTEHEVVYSGRVPTDRVLTRRQREILDAAVEEGFYDYPRQITLTELADRLGLAKSTVSQILMSIEKEIFDRLAVAGVVDLDQPGPDGPD